MSVLVFRRFSVLEDNFPLSKECIRLQFAAKLCGSYDVLMQWNLSAVELHQRFKSNTLVVCNLTVHRTDCLHSLAIAIRPTFKIFSLSYKVVTTWSMAIFLWRRNSCI